ncbi:hypothetical protein GGI35DRAFT_147180 [Trichoderma velutinum]
MLMREIKILGILAWRNKKRVYRYGRLRGRGLEGYRYGTGTEHRRAYAGRHGVVDSNLGQSLGIGRLCWIQTAPWAPCIGPEAMQPMSRLILLFLLRIASCHPCVVRGVDDTRILISAAPLTRCEFLPSSGKEYLFAECRVCRSKTQDHMPIDQCVVSYLASDSRTPLLPQPKRKSLLPVSPNASSLPSRQPRPYHRPARALVSAIPTFLIVT